MSSRTPSASSAPMAPLDWAALVLLSVIWGGSFFFGKIAIAEIPPLTMVLARVGIGALALVFIASDPGASAFRWIGRWRGPSRCWG